MATSVLRIVIRTGSFSLDELVSYGGSHLPFYINVLTSGYSRDKAVDILVSLLVSVLRLLRLQIMGTNPTTPAKTEVQIFGVVLIFPSWNIIVEWFVYLCRAGSELNANYTFCCSLTQNTHSFSSIDDQ